MLAHEILTGVTSKITVLLDTAKDDILKDFRCTCCGRVVFQYYGNVNLMLPGGTTVEWIDIVGRPKPIQCKNKRRIMVDGREVETRCKTIYYVIG